MTEVPALLETHDVGKLREALSEAAYTSRGIAERIGAVAVEAARRNDFRALLPSTA